MNIFIFSPAYMDNSGMPSINLGDIIIRYSIDGVLTKLFPDAKREYASSHTPPPEEMLKRAQHADLVLIAGSNLLSSNILQYNQWKLYKEKANYIHPQPLNAILCGTGWWQYQEKPDYTTSKYYTTILHKQKLHSVRDDYTKRQLNFAGINNVINTSCPTLWTLGGKETSRTANNKRCLFCLTDYSKHIDDNALISLLCEHYDELLFYPQGTGDAAYITQLDAFLRHQEKIAVLPHDIQIFTKLTRVGGLDYVGTRLHAGAWCLQHGLQTLILAVDNRATEIARDTHLPVVDRSDLASLRRWLAGEQLFPPIILPENAIRRWEKNISDG